MHQIHLQEFVWEQYKHAQIRGKLTIFYSTGYCRGVEEEYDIEVRDPGLKGWALSEIDANMLAPFIPSCVTLCNRVRQKG